MSNSLIVVVLGIGSVAMALGSTWALLDRIGKKVTGSVERVVDTKLRELKHTELDPIHAQLTTNGGSTLRDVVEKVGNQVTALDRKLDRHIRMKAGRR